MFASIFRFAFKIDSNGTLPRSSLYQLRGHLVVMTLGDSKNPLCTLNCTAHGCVGNLRYFVQITYRVLLLDVVLQGPPALHGAAKQGLIKGLYLYRVLCTVYRVLCTVYCVPCAVYCVLCTVYCVPCTVYRVPCTVYRVPCTVYCVLCSVYCVPCTVYCVPCTVYCVLCTVYCVPCNVYRVPCTVYRVLCTVYLQGHAVTQLVEALRYQPEGRGFYSRCCH